MKQNPKNKLLKDIVIENIINSYKFIVVKYFAEYNVSCI